jgi:hypothetical protein
MNIPIDKSIGTFLIQLVGIWFTVIFTMIFFLEKTKTEKLELEKTCNCNYQLERKQ